MTDHTAVASGQPTCQGSAEVQPGARHPVWSGAATTRLAALVEPAWRPATLHAVKAIHTGIFASVGGAILVVIWDGIRQRPGRRTAFAAGVVLVESAVFASNNQVCPLTPLAEQLGAGRGSVADMFLPGWVSQRIPIVGSIGLTLGLVLNLGAWLRTRREWLGHGSESRPEPSAA